MPTVQPNFDIDFETLDSLARGALELTHAVIKNPATGKVVKQLRVIMPKDIIENTQPALEVAKNVDLNIAKDTYKSLGAKFAVGTLIVAGIAAVGYGTYKLVTYLSKQTKETEKNNVVNENNDVIMYNPELTEYFNNMQTQSMTLDSIKKVVVFFENYNNGSLSIEINEEEMKVLRDIIVRYAIKLCESNNISLEDKQLYIEGESKNKNDLIHEILYATSVQQEIFVAN